MGGDEVNLDCVMNMFNFDFDEVMVDVFKFDVMMVEVMR